MKLKYLAIALAAGAPLAAQAQSASTVTLYGTIDTAIEYLSNVNNGGGTVVFPTNTSSFPSLWGLRGQEKINDNLTAIFTLESGFAPSTGMSNQGGRLFGRQAFVGLKGDWGQIALGRQYTMLFWAMGRADLIGPNSFGLAAFDDYIANARMDNSITYRGTFSGFTVGLGYTRGYNNVRGGGPGGLGNPAANGCGVQLNSESECGGWSAMLGYDSAKWGVATAYDVQTGVGQAPAAGAAANTYPAYSNNGPALGYLASGQKDRRWTLNGYAKFDALTVGAGYLYRNTDGGAFVPSPRGPVANAARTNHRFDTYFLNAAYDFSPAFRLDGAVYYTKLKDLGERATYYMARGTYSFSKRTAVYAAVAHVNNGGNLNFAVSGGSPGSAPAAGQNQTGVMAGLRHRF